MHEPYLRAMAALLRRSAPRHDLYTVFGDCMEAMAIAMANNVDLREREAREARYLDIVGRYQRDVIDLFPRVLAELVQALEAESGDVLGALFHDLELHSKARGQFFTPFTLSRFMARATLGNPESMKALIAEHGFVTAMEPACGAGSMVIALAEAIHDLGINYQHHLHVTAIDIDPHDPYGLCPALAAPYPGASHGGEFPVGRNRRALVHTGPYPGWMERQARPSPPQGTCRYAGRPGPRKNGPAIPGAKCSPSIGRARPIATGDAAATEPFLTN